MGVVRYEIAVHMPKFVVDGPEPGRCEALEELTPSGHTTLCWCGPWRRIVIVAGLGGCVAACGISVDASADALAARHAASPRARTDGGAQLEVPPDDLPNDERPWTLIVLPDTQYYAASYPEIFAAQTRWIVENRERLNIKIVMQAGDIVDTWNDQSQWNVADQSLSQIINANIPYTPTPGDHDHEGQSPDGSTEYFHQHFPETRFRDKPWWGGDYNANTNHFVLLTIAGEDYVFMGMDFCPSPDEIGWAYGVFSAYSDRKAILVTHALIDDLGGFDGESDCSRFDGDVSYIWKDLITHQKNLRLAFGGHMHLGDGEYNETLTNDFGEPVHLVQADYQMWENGGNGRLRIMTFDPLESEIRVQTYSPWTQTKETDVDSEFVLPYPMRGQP